ncbi:IAA-amino acid hydrolase ILR1-like 4 [Stylosanthes scabra]|uniref:IAA-amino acid hydrolase ILR1-like 4 n=1 Tax=Stylosanthes scabra TaxID=79078 RepID=A0ABU6ZMF9_9FABA|nr:IAA-amino acid hydrolase ILR1-like 4 [Stylosanthes scabra]
MGFFLKLFCFCFLIIIFHVFVIATPVFSHSNNNNNERSSSSISSKFLDLAKSPEVFDWMVKIRRKIHEYPELVYEEYKTSEVIRAELDKLGISYKHPVAETGVIGYIGTGNAPFVALRADIDGLPIQEMVEWEHKSKVDGKMHACGHDAHTAMLLGAAKILKHHEYHIKGTVVLVFQPAEEGGAGAKRVLKEGVLDKVSAIFGLHVAHVLPVGHVASKAGPLMAGSGSFHASIHGKGGHAAMPQFAIDPVLAASSIVLNLQHLVSREADPLDPQVVTVANFHGDGAFNVIPDSVTIGGTFRAFSRQSLTRLKDRIQQVITGQAAVYQCTAEVDFHEDQRPLYPATINDDKLHEHFVDVAKNVVGNMNVHEMQPVTVSEDFSFYQEALPGYFFMLGMQSLGAEPLATLHSPHFTVNEDALPYGAALHASLATNYLLKHDYGTAKVGGKYHDEL